MVMNEQDRLYLSGEVKDNNQRREARRRETYNRRKKQKRRKKRVVLIVIAFVIVLIFTSVLLITGRKDKLCGAWTFADSTYAFDGKGRGSMDITAAKYSYTYKIKKDRLIIDFKEENIHDCTYGFSIDGNTLTLVGLEGTVGGTYELHRKTK